jgi:hypothetical protein
MLVTKKRKTDREEIKTPLEILLIVGLESGGPSLEFSFEGHVGQVETDGKGSGVGKRRRGRSGFIFF